MLPHRLVASLRGLILPAVALLCAALLASGCGGMLSGAQGEPTSPPAGPQTETTVAAVSSPPASPQPESTARGTALPTSSIIEGTAVGGPILTPQAATGRPLSLRSVVIYDDSGNEIGAGQVRLYAPDSIRLTEATKIRLEISAGLRATAVALTPEGATVTPGSSGATATPLVIETLTLHEIMGATLQGVDTAHFAINTIPQNGLRNIAPDGLTWWEWNLRPVGPEAIGANFLQLLIYYPRTDANGNSFDEQIANFPVTITVEGPTPTPPDTPTTSPTPSVTPSPTFTPAPTHTPTPTPPPPFLEQLGKGLDPLVKIAGAITAIAAAIGAIYGTVRLISGRAKKSEGGGKES